MKNWIYFILSLGLVITFSFTKSKTSNNFELHYAYAGLGSNMGSKQPVFRVKDGAFCYTMEQNSHYGEVTLLPDTVCQGEFSSSSQDSIIKWISSISDTLIYDSNPSVSSGGLHNFIITINGKKLTIRLHNAYNPLAEKIINELNKHIPDEGQKLAIFKYN